MQQRSNIAFVTTCIYVKTIFKKFSMATFKGCLKIYAVLKNTTDKYIVINYCDSSWVPVNENL